MLMDFEVGDLLWSEEKDEVEGLRSRWLGVASIEEAGIAILAA